MLYINISHNIKLELPTRPDREENNVKRVQLIMQCCQTMLLEVTYIGAGDVVNYASEFLLDLNDCKV